MSPRHFVYGTMVNYTPLTSLIGGPTAPRIFAKKSMTSSMEQHPFIVYKLGNDTADFFSEEYEISRQFFQVWVHDFHDDDHADYDRIDAVLHQVKAAFRFKTADGIWAARFIETSQDFNDDTLNTVFRYLRFQLVRKEG